MNTVDTILAHTPEQRAHFLALLGYPRASIIGSIVREYALNDAQATEITNQALTATADERAIGEEFSVTDHKEV